MDRDTPSRMSPADRVTDVIGSVRAYAVQETVGPARGAARWLAFGTLAALFLGVAVLRLSQDLGGDALDGAWSFVHYLVSALVLGTAVTVALSRTSRKTLAKD